MFFRSKLGLSFALLVALGVPTLLHAQDPTTPEVSRRGRKYKAPPETSHIEVLVTKESNGKPLPNAAVVFRPIKDGHDEGNLEVKTNADGKAIIDVVPTGSDVGIQIIADGYATYAGDFVVKEASRSIEIKMIRPRAQISTYVDTNGKPSDRPVGVQEPGTPHTPPVIQTPRPTNNSSDPNPLTPIDPKATPGNTQNKTNPPATGVPPPQ
jgi:hypothetical protein